MDDGNILVVNSTDKDMMEAIRKASGLVTEEGGLTSHAAVVGLSLGIPVIVGVDHLFDKVKDGELITIDSETGEIHQGHANVL